MITREDLFVGIISVILGLTALAAAARNWDWFYNLSAARRIQGALGRSAARIFYAVVGALLIVLGAFIALQLVEM